LKRLFNDKVKSIADVPPECPRKARDLYFRIENEPPKAFSTLAALDVGKLQPAIRSHLAQAAGELSQARERISAQYAEIRTLEERLAEETAQHRALARSVLAQAASAGARSPHLAEALAEFEQHLAATITPGYRRDVMTLCAEFVASLPDSCSTLVDVTVEQIARFLDAKSVASQPSQPLTRYTRYRIKLGRLINWAAQRWGYPSQMSGVRAFSPTQVGRERGEIHWHDMAEVEAVIRGLDTYWAALVASLAYAGLQLAELCWLRREDLIWGPERKTAQLRVCTVTEGEVRHYLKSAHRRRIITVHQRLLIPRLELHLQAIKQSTYLFPTPEGNRRARKTADNLERWLPHALSVVLRGHPGGKCRAPSQGLLPPGMNAKSLRRTFGSLLIRSGATEAQVAAAMGNTPSVVRAHYARILGGEVDVDF
jgi:integrase